MMEEASSDEQPEMVTHEEAEAAEEEAKACMTPSKPTEVPPNLSAPSPLPAFLQKTGNAAEPQPTPLPQVAVSSSAPVPISAPAPPLATAVSISPPIPRQDLSIAAPTLASAPESQNMPHDGGQTSAAASDSSKAPAATSGLFGWISSSSLVNRVVEKTKTHMESVITTLDPGMKAVIHSGGDVEVVVCSSKDSKVVPVREAFQNVFGRATVSGKFVQRTNTQACQASTAAQPVGFTAGLKGAEDRIATLRRTATVPDGVAVVAVEGFIVEMLPDRWFEMSCLLLKDPSNGIELQTFSQPTLIPNEYIIKAQDKTPSDYPLKWAGLAVTIGAVIEDSDPHIGHADWQAVLSGVPRQQSLGLAARSLAHMYRERLPHVTGPQG